MSQIVLRPIRSIRETADRIRSDNFSERIPVSDVRDELSELAEMLNRTFDRLERTFIQMRRFSEEVSHELKTPLSFFDCMPNKSCETMRAITQTRRSSRSRRLRG